MTTRLKQDNNTIEIMFKNKEYFIDIDIMSFIISKLENRKIKKLNAYETIDSLYKYKLMQYGIFRDMMRDLAILRNTKTE